MASGLEAAAVGVAVAIGLGAFAWGWTRLGIVRRRRALGRASGGEERFDPDEVADLPAPARRYLTHAIDAGRPLAAWGRVETTGTIDLGEGPREFSATETVARGRGFLWDARVRLSALLSVTGADYYVDGDGGQRFSLWGVVPMVRTDGAGVTRSNRERFAAECVWLPTALVPAAGASWEALDERRARVTPPGTGTPVTVTVAEGGRLEAVDLDRYRGDRDTSERFCLRIETEASVDGLTVPGTIRAGWNLEESDAEEFYRADLESATYR